MTKRVQVYETPEITVTFDPNICIHSGVCVRGLPAVFDVRRRDWVRAYAASAEEVAAQIKRCPSGALQYRLPTSEADAGAMASRPDFSGDWTLNVAASELSAAVAPVVERGSLHIVHREPSVSIHLSITMSGQPVAFRFERPSSWDGDALSFTDTESTPDGQLTISFRYELMDSGKRLRAVERLRGAGREQDNVWVFERE